MAGLATRSVLHTARRLLAARGGARVTAHCSTAASSSLLKQFTDQIRMTGPITVHQYMRAVLTHPRGGYYMHKDVFGEHGDYTTSPEISQMFGELLGVWVYSEWVKMGRETPLLLLELGPGRGTLMADILRVLKQFKVKPEELHIHLVEISPFMRDTQRKTLNVELAPASSEGSEGGVTADGSSVCWHDLLDTVPRGFTITLAHEFFDVLPVHKLVKRDGQWREVLIDINGDVGYGGYGDNTSHALSSTDATSTAAAGAVLAGSDASEASSLPLRYVLSRTQTPACVAYTQDMGERDSVELSPEAAVMMGQLAALITECGGAVLMVDYGHNGSRGDTFRAFRDHRQVHPLASPGSADLTADVDFSLLRASLPDTVTCYGPVTQSFFLKNMGIELRLMRLLQSSTNDRAAHTALRSSYRRLVQDMGLVFQVMAVYPSVMKPLLLQQPPPGFFRELGDPEQPGGTTASE